MTSKPFLEERHSLQSPVRVSCPAAPSVKATVLWLSRAGERALLAHPQPAAPRAGAGRGGQGRSSLQSQTSLRIVSPFRLPAGPTGHPLPRSAGLYTRTAGQLCPGIWRTGQRPERDAHRRASA